jgi:hypothetical protein
MRDDRSFAPLNAEDICRIIEVSAKAGVVELSVDDLHLKFGQQPTPRAPDPVPQPPVPSYPVTGTEPPAIDPEKLAEEVRNEENELRREMLFDELNLLAPHLAEQMMSAGEIKNEKPAGTGTEG